MVWVKRECEVRSLLGPPASPSGRVRAHEPGLTDKPRRSPNRPRRSASSRLSPWYRGAPAAAGAGVSRLPIHDGWEPSRPGLWSNLTKERTAPNAEGRDNHEVTPPAGSPVSGPRGRRRSQITPIVTRVDVPGQPRIVTDRPPSLQSVTAQQNTPPPHGRFHHSEFHDRTFVL